MINKIVDILYYLIECTEPEQIKQLNNLRYTHFVIDQTLLMRKEKYTAKLKEKYDK